MRKIVWMLSLTVLFLIFSATSVFAIPTHCPGHQHDAATVHWEADGGLPGGWGLPAPGGGCHNHRDTCNFNALSEEGGYNPVEDPAHPTWYHQVIIEDYEPYAVWDCRAVREDDDADFDAGHGFINEFPALGGGPAEIPRYRFHVDAAGNDPDPTGGPWPAAAQTAIRNAFSQWSAIASDRLNHVVGLEFREVARDAEAEIVIHWHNIDALGLTDLNPGGLSTVTFDSDPGDPAPAEPWFYGAAAATPAGQFHFLTIALHETGHVVGLDDQGDHAANDDDNMIWQFGTGPAGPAFDDIRPESVHGARDLYMIELTHEQAGMLKAGTGVISAVPAVAPVSTPATISITNTGPVPIQLMGWTVTRPDGRVDGVVFTAPYTVVLPGATVVVTVYAACEIPGLYRVRVDYDPIAETTFQRYAPYVGGEMILYGSLDSADNAGLLIPYIRLTSTIAIAAVATAIYVKHRKKKQ